MSIKCMWHVCINNDVKCNVKYVRRNKVRCSCISNLSLNKHIYGSVSDSSDTIVQLRKQLSLIDTGGEKAHDQLFHNMFYLDTL